MKIYCQRFIVVFSLMIILVTAIRGNCYYPNRIYDAMGVYSTSSSPVQFYTYAGIERCQKALEVNLKLSPYIMIWGHYNGDNDCLGYHYEVYTPVPEGTQPSLIFIDVVMLEDIKEIITHCIRYYGHGIVEKKNLKGDSFYNIYIDPLHIPPVQPAASAPPMVFRPEEALLSAQLPMIYGPNTLNTPIYRGSFATIGSEPSQLAELLSFIPFSSYFGIPWNFSPQSLISSEIVNFELPIINETNPFNRSSHSFQGSYPQQFTSLNCSFIPPRPF